MYFWRWQKGRVMSLGIVIKGPEGIVLAADSRVTLDAPQQGNKAPISVHFDNATKLLSFRDHPYVGAVTYGTAVIRRRTPHSYIPEFENELEGGRLPVKEFAQKLSDFFQERLKSAEQTRRPPGADTVFIVGGYDEGKPYGEVYLVSIPHQQPNPDPRNDGDNNFGMTLGGQNEIATRLIQGYDPKLLSMLKSDYNFSDGKQLAIEKSLKRLNFPIPLHILPLQDCVNFAITLIRTTILIQSLGITARGVGGPIDVATITRTDGLQFIQKKEIQGETS